MLGHIRGWCSEVSSLLLLSNRVHALVKRKYENYCPHDYTPSQVMINIHSSALLPAQWLYSYSNSGTHKLGSFISIKICSCRYIAFDGAEKTWRVKVAWKLENKLIQWKWLHSTLSFLRIHLLLCTNTSLGALRKKVYFSCFITVLMKEFIGFKLTIDCENSLKPYAGCQ